MGIDSRGAYWQFEYPLMRLLREDLYSPRFESFNVQNISKRLSSGYIPPDVVVCYHPEEAVEDPVTGLTYVPAARFGEMTVLRPAAGIAP